MNPLDARLTRRDALRAAAALGASGALATYGPRATARAAGPATLTVASFYPVNQTSGWANLVAQFKSAYPDVTIQTQISSFDAYIPKILAQKASGTLPDVLGVEVSQFARFASEGVLLDLTDRLAKEKAFSKRQFFPKLIDRYTYQSSTFGIPYDCQPVAGIYYNKAFFDKAHVPYPTRKWTWAEMLAAARKLTVRSGNRIVQYGLDPGDGLWETWLYAYGGRVVDDYRRPKRFVLDSPRAIAAFKAYVSLFQGPNQVAPTPDFVTSSGLSDADLFAAGKIAMFVGAYWNLVNEPQKYTALKPGYALVPAGPYGDRGYPTGGTCYAVSSATKNPGLAYAFVKYFMGMPGWTAAYNGAPMHIIFPPAYYPAYYSKLFLYTPHPPIENMWINGYGAQYAIFHPNDPNWVELDNKILEPAVDQMILGRKPVEATLKTITAELTAGLAVNQH